MGNLNRHEIGSIIDTASLRLGSKPQAPNCTTSNVHQLAMARRLEQLNAALGEGETTPKPAAGTPAATSRRRFGATALFLTAIVSATMGAASMSLARQAEPVPDTAPAIPQTTRSVAAPEAAVVVAKPQISDEQLLGEQLEAWRSAWAQRHVAAYLDAYSPDFRPADGSSRDAWVSARTKKLSAGAPITLEINKLALERVDGEHFKATFLQDYAAGGYRESAKPKTLLFARQDGKWRITAEWQE